jgi:hypothetical protein
MAGLLKLNGDLLDKIFDYLTPMLQMALTNTLRVFRVRLASMRVAYLIDMQHIGRFKSARILYVKGSWEACSRMDALRTAAPPNLCFPSNFMSMQHMFEQKNGFGRTNTDVEQATRLYLSQIRDLHTLLLPPLGESIASYAIMMHGATIHRLKLCLDEGDVALSLLRSVNTTTGLVRLKLLSRLLL